MLTLYLVSLILGGLLVALSIFAGGDAELDTDIDGFEADAGELEAHASEVGAMGQRTRILNFRNATFLVAFFGLTGTLFTLFGIGRLLTAPFAVGGGLAAAGAVHLLMRRLGQEEVGTVPDAGALAGSLAQVVVGFDDTAAGKIAIRGGDRTLQLVARVHQDAEVRRFGPGDEVVVVDVDQGIARVAATRFIA